MRRLVCVLVFLLSPLSAGCRRPAVQTPPVERPQAQPELPTDGSVQQPSPGGEPREAASSSTHPLDERIAANSLVPCLERFVRSVGAGWGDGYRPSGYLAVQAAGRTLYEQSLGQANYETNTSNTRDTSFRIGGLTRQFTAAAILRLVAEGKLRLSDRIGSLLPSYPEVGRAITVQQLLQHRSGLPRYRIDMISAAEADGEPQRTPTQDLLSRFWTRRLDFDPGEQTIVSNSAYAVLGAIIEAVSKQSYSEYVQRELFQPLGMTQTVLESAASDPNEEQWAVGYEATPGSGMLRLAPVPQDGYAAAGMRSSVSDLLRWHSALTRGKVVSSKLESLWYQPVQGKRAVGGIVSKHEGLLAIRDGDTSRSLPGFRSQLIRVPELSLAVVVLGNSGSFDARMVADAALRCSLGEPVDPLRKRASVALDPNAADAIRGAYLLSPNAREDLEARNIPAKVIRAMRSASIFLKQDALYFKPAGQGAIHMMPTGPTTFSLRNGKATLSVDIDIENPDETRLWLSQGPLNVEYDRKPARKPKEVEHLRDQEAFGEGDTGEGDTDE